MALNRQVFIQPNRHGSFSNGQPTLRVFYFLLILNFLIQIFATHIAHFHFLQSLKPTQKNDRVQFRQRFIKTITFGYGK